MRNCFSVTQTHFLWKKLLCVLIGISIILSGCALVKTGKQQYTITYMTLFDTVTTFVGCADSEEEFQKTARSLYEQLEEYHQLFDIYNCYDGIVNLKTVNDNAGIMPVKVDQRIISLLKDCKHFYEVTDGKVNIAMGSVLKLWHDARKLAESNPGEARVPKQEMLMQAAKHMDIEAVMIDEKESTVYISDPKVRLDVGAVAKGWSVQQVAENAPSGWLLSVGGNVCVTGPKDEKGSPWVVGIQDPNDPENWIQKVSITSGSVVTSGDYQRVYMVDGKAYHHIIDPDTLYPSDAWCSVTIICPDSGVADVLSTALFVMSREEGQKLLEQYRAKACWVDQEGKIYYSDTTGS